ncbi:hypothetical protein L1049_024007 [Liquidambar formosana]|uniref:Uncharacterized protein n=1 Tax=Liquidambar formosana TaxID=63359 RepID=A0AAP0WY33_LIQFO
MHASENSQSEPPVPDRPPSPEWKKWVVGILLSIVLPSFRHKWGPLLVLEEAVEDLAEGVEKVADVVEDKLPDHDTKLKEVTESVENLAKETVKEAEQVQEFAQKVEKLEEDVETLMEPGMDQAEVDGQKRAEDGDVDAKE